MSSSLKRKADGKMIAGVCAGIGDRFNIQPSIIRIAFVLLSFPAWFLTIPIYCALVRFLPEEQRRVPFNEKTTTQYAEPTVRYNTRPVSNPSISRPQASYTPSASIDINNASERELSSLPGLTKIQVKQMIKARDSRGGFQSIEEIGDVMGLKPHILAQLKAVAQISPMRGSASQQAGRRLDL